MMCSRQIAFSLVTLCGIGIAVVAILRRRYLLNADDDDDDSDEKDMIYITRKQAAKKKDIITQPAANEEDIISKMPDDILISIIEHMDPIFAVRTSILSKRWRNLYKFVSDIEFHCHDALVHYAAYDHEAFIYKVERYLMLRSQSRSEIRSFHFRCPLNKSYADQFEQCIHSLRRFNVEELVVYFSCSSNFSCSRWSIDLISFSCHLLSEMPSLKHLELALCSLQPNSKSQCNYTLQTIRLMHVTILPGALECILSNFLRLNSLIIDSCFCPSKLYFVGPNLQLKSLIIQDCEGIDEIELYASNLITLEVQNHGSVNFIFDHVPQLQSMHLSFKNEFLELAKHLPYQLQSMHLSFKNEFLELAKHLPYQKYLALSTHNDLDQENNRIMELKIEKLSNLRRLELIYYTVETNLMALTPYLESCPLLQEFHLDIPHHSEYVGAQVQPRKQEVLHLELKKVKISGFSGTENEMEFALYILKCAVSLEQMHIFCCTKDCYDVRDIIRRHERIEKQLQGQALSKTAQVIIK